MSISAVSAVSGSLPLHQATQTPKAKTGDERSESITVKAKEANALVLQARIIEVAALDIEA